MAVTQRARQFARQAILQRLASKPQASKLQKGFTLIELLVVIVILGILAAIALPALINQQNKAVAKGNDNQAVSAARACAAAIAGGSATDYDPVPNVTPTTCATGTLFTSNIDTNKADPATATVTTAGGVRLVKAGVPK